MRGLGWLAGAIRVVVVLFLCAAGFAQAQFDIITRSPPGVTPVVWRIDRPRVNQPTTDYPQIEFSPWDIVQVGAGGCVQIGGKGKTWKNYLYPKGADSGSLYRGEISIAGVTLGQEALSTYVGQKLQIPGSSGPVHLVLGYADNSYKDNSYNAHDNGDDDQCKNVGPAYVTVTITKASGPIVAMTEVRIAGSSYLNLAKKDGGDGATTFEGQTCVLHNPGCGSEFSVGNDGTDSFFDSSHPLPPLARLVKTEYAAVAADDYKVSVSGSGPDDGGSYGSYLSQVSPKDTDPQVQGVRWHNACTGANAKVNLYYQVSFLVSMPVGTVLNEPTFPIAEPAAPACAFQRSIAIPQFALSPDNGYVNPGQAVTVSWQVVRCGTDCNVTVSAYPQGGNPNVPLYFTHNQSATSHGTFFPSQTGPTTVTLSARGSAGGVTAKPLTVTLARAATTCTGCTTSYWKVVSTDAGVTFCSVVSITGQPANAASAVQAMEPDGSMITMIPADQATTACPY